MSALWNDFRYAARVLRKSPGYSIVAIMVLALGIGANAAIFTLMNAVFLRALPFPEPQNLVIGFEKNTTRPKSTVAYPNYLDWRAQSQVFTDLAAYRSDTFNLSGVDQPIRLDGRFVTAQFFDVLGLKPAIGRFFTEQEDKPGVALVLITHRFWQRYFAADPTVIGRTIILDSIPRTIIGVMPANYAAFRRDDDIIVPQGFIAGTPWQMNRSNHTGLYALGRLKPGKKLAEAKVELEGIAERLAKAYGNTNAGYSAGAESLADNLSSWLRSPLQILGGAVAFVLLIACVNVANLMLARATGRHREMTVRAALGASRWQLARQLLAESLILSAAGGIAGMLIAVWGLDVLMTLAPTNRQALSDVHMDWRAPAFTGGLSVVTGILFGLAPVWSALRSDLARALTQRSQTGSASTHGLRGVLLVAEVTLAVVLLVGAGLMIRSMLRLYGTNPGFDPQNLVTMKYELVPSMVKTRAEVLGFHQRVIDAAEAVPGVQSAALTQSLPVDNVRWTSIFVPQDKPLPARQDLPNSMFNPVSTGYLRTMGIRLLQGRWFTESDVESSPSVCVINEVLAKRIWPNENPIGKRLKQGFPETPTAWVEVVGVVNAVKQEALAEEEWMQTYFPVAQRPSLGGTLVVRVAGGDPLIAARSIEKQLHVFNKDVPVYDVRKMEDVISGSLTERRFSMLLLAVFAGLALVLAAVGIYGLMAYTVAERRQEIGVRIALGASARDILGAVVSRGMMLVAGGLLLGTAASMGLTRFLAAQLYEVGAYDPQTWLGVVSVLALSALAACLVPAWRALRVDPVEALRAE